MGSEEWREQNEGPLGPLSILTCPSLPSQGRTRILLQVGLALTLQPARWPVLAGGKMRGAGVPEPRTPFDTPVIFIFHFNLFIRFGPHPVALGLLQE